MSKSQRRNSRRWHGARRSARRRLVNPSCQSPHEEAILQLRRWLQLGVGLLGYFHSGVVSWGIHQVIAPGRRVVVQRERSWKLSGRRFRPDLTVTCALTGDLLCLIEVWHSHAVRGPKRDAYLESNRPWIEVPAMPTWRCRQGDPIPVIDWGGLSLPSDPHQEVLFDLQSHLQPEPPTRAVDRSLRVSDRIACLSAP
jgi:hypothetical protein